MVMPKMGESIMEGTILKWLKKEGDSINEDESVLEVATDKVDTEIPSTCSGTISQILVNEGDIVKVGSPIAIIETEQNTGSKTIDSDYVKDLESSFSEIKNDITSPPEIKDKNILLLAIEKGSNRKAFTESIYSINGQESIDKNSEVFNLFTKARDEAHRFAIKANRDAKRKNMQASILDSIHGIGPKTKEKLFNIFKSINAILDADEEQLVAVKGINKRIAREILKKAKPS